MMTELIYLLRKSRLFYDIPEEAMEELIQSLGGHVKRLQKGEFWINEGMKVDQIGVILCGEMAVLRICANGQQHLMQKLKSSFMIGLDVVCTENQGSPYDIQALEDTELYQFPWSVLAQPGLINETYRRCIMKNILRMISHENIRKTYKIEILMQKGLRNRIMTYLIIEKRKRKKDVFTIPYSREEMADFLCVNRSALSHELSLMQKDGLIKFRQNEFEVL